MSRMAVQVVMILGTVLILFIGWDFSQRFAQSFRLSQTEQDLDKQIAQAQTRRTELQELKKRVQTDAFIEDRARRQHYVRDGEFLVVPMITPAAPPISVAPSAPENGDSQQAPQPDWWQSWYEFLFGP